MLGTIGWPEILMILVLALLVFGPRRLPELGRSLGRAMGEFRRASADLKRTLNAELALEDDERQRAPRRPELPGAGARAAEVGAAVAARPSPADTTPRKPAAVADPYRSLEPLDEDEPEEAREPEVPETEASAPADASGRSGPAAQRGEAEPETPPDGPEPAATTH